jgi:AraC-like DNA-binding protein
LRFREAVAIIPAMSGSPAQVVQTFRERLPAAALAPYATCVWVQRISPDSASHAHCTAPNGSAELVCALGSAPRLVGPQTGPVEQVIAPGTTVVGVRFRPGAAPSVLGMPASELVDLDVAVEDLWGASTRAPADALASCASAPRGSAILEEMVAGRLADGPRPDPVALEAVQRLPRQTTRIGSLASSLFISERQLRRRCEAATGLAPKALQRIFRFQRFLALAWTYERPSAYLPRLAAEAGYADQSHLTREAMRLHGRSPRTILLEAEEHCGRAHDHAASYAPLLRAA